MFQNYCGLHWIVSGEHIHVWSSDVEYTYPTRRHIRKSNRIIDFYLKIVRNLSSIHLKAGIVTALEIGQIWALGEVI